MKNFCCNNCGCLDCIVTDIENKQVLMCAHCGKWIKSIPKSELPLFKKLTKSDKITLSKVSKLFNVTEEIILLRESKDGTFKRETLEIWEIEDSKYAESEVIGIDYYIELIQSCEAILEITPVLTIYDI